MELRAITYNYVEDGVWHNKVVGIFTREQLEGAMDDIRNGYGSGKRIICAQYDKSCDNYFLEFDNNSYFYTSNYTVGELRL